MRGALLLISGLAIIPCGTLCAQTEDPLEQARQLEAQGEAAHRLSDIGEARRLWTEALRIRQTAIGDSAPEAAVGYAHQARYHDFMTGTALAHAPLALREASRAKRLVRRRQGRVSPSERAMVLREFAYAYKVNGIHGAPPDSTWLRQTRTYFREALASAVTAKDTIWIAQVSHDIGNTFTDEAIRYNQQWPRGQLRAKVDSALRCYSRSTALMIASGQGASELVMMDQLTTGLLYREAYGPDSADRAVAAYDRALRIMHRMANGADNTDPQVYVPRIRNKAQMVELFYLRSFSLADPHHAPHSAEQASAALKSLQAAVPYWESMLRDYHSRDMHKVVGSYSHFPFRYGTYLAAELYNATGDTAYLHQALDWYDRNRNGLEQRDRLRSGAGLKQAIGPAHLVDRTAPGSVVVAFHDFPQLMACVINEQGTRILNCEGTDLAASVEGLGAAMKADDSRAYEQLAHRLYRDLLHEALRGRSARSLVVVPSAGMSQLAFDALVTDTSTSPTWGTLSYLVNEVEVRYARSIAEALMPVQGPASSAFNWAMAMPTGGSELPFSNALVQERSTGRSHPLTVDTLLHLLRMDQPLHLAAHAEALVGVDEQPRLLLNDGPLPLAALDAMRIAAPLVVLGACATGHGQHYTGEGTLGLGQTLLRNGARTVVHTLWRVDDRATSEVLGEMHDGLADGLCGTEALTLAKRRFISEHADDGLANPFYWSGIALAGADVQLTVPRRRWWLLVLPLVAGYWLWRRSRKVRARAASETSYAPITASS